MTIKICTEYQKKIKIYKNKKYKQIFNKKIFENIINDYCEEYKLTEFDIRYLVKYFKNNNNIQLNKINNYRKNYQRGILPTLLKMCQLIYYKGIYLNSFKNINVISSLEYNIQIYFIKDLNTIILVFRGKSTIKDLKSIFIDTTRKKYNILNKKTKEKYEKWFKNFSKSNPKLKINKNYNIPKIHSGTYDNILKILPFIKQFINKIKLKKTLNPTIICTGHSYGGMNAEVMGIVLKDLYPKININIISFASPGIGNRNLSLFFKFLNFNKFIRIYNSYDPLVKLRDETIFDNLIGNLRQPNYLINNKYIIKNDNKNDNENEKKYSYINIDCFDFLPEKIKSKKEEKYESNINSTIFHTLFKFNKINDDKIFQIC